MPDEEYNIIFDADTKELETSLDRIQKQLAKIAEYSEKYGITQSDANEGALKGANNLITKYEEISRSVKEFAGIWGVIGEKTKNIGSAALANLQREARLAKIEMDYLGKEVILLADDLGKIHGKKIDLSLSSQIKEAGKDLQKFNSQLKETQKSSSLGGTLPSKQAGKHISSSMSNLEDELETAARNLESSLSSNDIGTIKKAINKFTVTLESISDVAEGALKEFVQSKLAQINGVKRQGIGSLIRKEVLDKVPDPNDIDGKVEVNRLGSSGRLISSDRLLNTDRHGIPTHINTLTAAYEELLGQGKIVGDIKNNRKTGEWETTPLKPVYVRDETLDATTESNTFAKELGHVNNQLPKLLAIIDEVKGIKTNLNPVYASNTIPKMDTLPIRGHAVVDEHELAIMKAERISAELRGDGSFEGENSRAWVDANKFEPWGEQSINDVNRRVGLIEDPILRQKAIAAGTSKAISAHLWERTGKANTNAPRIEGTSMANQLTMATEKLLKEGPEGKNSAPFVYVQIYQKLKLYLQELERAGQKGSELYKEVQSAYDILKTIDKDEKKGIKQKTGTKDVAFKIAYFKPDSKKENESDDEYTKRIDAEFVKKNPKVGKTYNEAKSGLISDTAALKVHANRINELQVSPTDTTTWKQKIASAQTSSTPEHIKLIQNMQVEASKHIDAVLAGDVKSYEELEKVIIETYQRLQKLFNGIKDEGLKTEIKEYITAVNELKKKSATVTSFANNKDMASVVKANLTGMQGDIYGKSTTFTTKVLANSNTVKTIPSKIGYASDETTLKEMETTLKRFVDVATRIVTPKSDGKAITVGELTKELGNLVAEYDKSMSALTKNSTLLNEFRSPLVNILAELSKIDAKSNTSSFLNLYGKKEYETDAMGNEVATQMRSAIEQMVHQLKFEITQIKEFANRIRLNDVPPEKLQEVNSKLRGNTTANENENLTMEREQLDIIVDKFRIVDKVAQIMFENVQKNPAFEHIKDEVVKLVEEVNKFKITTSEGEFELNPKLLSDIDKATAAFEKLRKEIGLIDSESGTPGSNILTTQATSFCKRMNADKKSALAVFNSDSFLDNTVSVDSIMKTKEYRDNYYNKGKNIKLNTENAVFNVTVKKPKYEGGTGKFYDEGSTKLVIRHPTFQPKIAKPEFDKKFYKEGSIQLNIKNPIFRPEIATGHTNQFFFALLESVEKISTEIKNLGTIIKKVAKFFAPMVDSLTNIDIQMMFLSNHVADVDHHIVAMGSHLAGTVNRGVTDMVVGFQAALQAATKLLNIQQKINVQKGASYNTGNQNQITIDNTTSSKSKNVSNQTNLKGSNSFLGSILEKANFVNAVGGGVTGAGISMMYTFTQPLLFGMQSMITQASDVQENIQRAANNMTQNASANASAVIMMTDLVNKIAVKTGSTRSDVAKSVRTITAAGYQAGEVPKMTEEVTIAAQAMGADPEAAFKNIDSLMRIFGKDAKSVANELSYALDATKLDFEQLATIIQYVAPVAKTIGLPMEKMLAISAEMVSKGLDASVVGTNLRGMLMALIKPTTAIKEAMAKYGIQITDNSEKFYEYSQQIESVQKQMELMKKQESGLKLQLVQPGSNKKAIGDQIAVLDAQYNASKLKLADLQKESKKYITGAIDDIAVVFTKFQELVAEGKMKEQDVIGLFRATQVSGASILFQADWANITNLSKAIGESTSATDKFKLMMESIPGKTKKVEAEIEVLRGQLYAAFMPTVTSIASFIDKNYDKISGMVTGISKEFGKLLGKLVTTGTQMLSWFTSLDKGTQSIISAQSATLLFAAALSGPLLLYTGSAAWALGYLGQAVLQVGNTFNKTTASIGKFMTIAVVAKNNPTEWANKLVNPDAWQSVMNAYKGAENIPGVLDNYKGFAKPGKIVYDYMLTLKNGIVEFGSSAKQAFLGLFSLGFGGFIAKLTALKAAILSVNFAVNAAVAAIAVFAIAYATNFAHTRDVVNATVSVMIDKITALGNAISNVFNKTPSVSSKPDSLAVLEETTMSALHGSKEFAEAVKNMENSGNDLATFDFRFDKAGTTVAGMYRFGKEVDKIREKLNSGQKLGLNEQILLTMTNLGSFSGLTFDVANKIQSDIDKLNFDKMLNQIEDVIPATKDMESQFNKMPEALNVFSEYSHVISDMKSKTDDLTHSIDELKNGIEELADMPISEEKAQAAIEKAKAELAIAENKWKTAQAQNPNPENMSAENKKDYYQTSLDYYNAVSGVNKAQSDLDTLGSSNELNYIKRVKLFEDAYKVTLPVAMQTYSDANAKMLADMTTAATNEGNNRQTRMQKDTGAIDKIVNDSIQKTKDAVRTNRIEDVYKGAALELFDKNNKSLGKISTSDLTEYQKDFNEASDMTGVGQNIVNKYYDPTSNETNKAFKIDKTFKPESDKAAELITESSDTLDNLKTYIQSTPTAMTDTEAGIPEAAPVTTAPETTQVGGTEVPAELGPITSPTAVGAPMSVMISNIQDIMTAFSSTISALAQTLTFNVRIVGLSGPEAGLIVAASAAALTTGINVNNVQNTTIGKVYTGVPGNVDINGIVSNFNWGANAVGVPNAGT